jgi:hypothetical protein
VPTTNGTCPAGQTGTVTREKEQAQTSTTSYSCPAGTAALPAPSTSVGSWVDTGAVRDISNTCVAAVVTCTFRERVVAVPNSVCLLFDDQTACTDGSASVSKIVLSAAWSDFVGFPQLPAWGGSPKMCASGNVKSQTAPTRTSGPKKY